MNTTKKIAVVLAVLMVAALAAPAAMGVEYTATVQDMYNVDVAIGVGGVAFGGVTAGTPFADNELVNSLKLTNDGNHEATVEAKFTSQAAAAGASDYGLVGDTDIAATKVLIDGTNFKLGKDGAETALKNTAVDTALAGSNVPANGFVDYDAQLNVPSGQKADVYTGTILLTFAKV